MYGLHAARQVSQCGASRIGLENGRLAVRSRLGYHHAATCGIPGDNGVPEDVGADEFNYVVSVNPVAMPLLQLPRLPCMAVVIHSL
jgi:hypothetical protein